MIQLLFALLLAEMAMLLLLLSPIRKPVVIAIEYARRGHNFRLLSITFLSSLLLLFLFNIYSILEVRYRPRGSNPMDQLIIAEKLLAASLLGFLLFLCVVIPKLHVLMREWCSIEESRLAEEKQLAKRNLIARESLKASKDEIADLKSHVMKLESVLEERKKEIMYAEAEVSMLRKQSEDVNMKYLELFEYNETIRNQLQIMVEHKQEEKEESVWSNLKATNVTCGGFIQFPWNNNLKSNRSKMEVGPEIEMQTNVNRTSSARHRQPIYIVDAH